MPRRIITEEELREAAREVLEYELAIFDSYNNYPDHIFHGKFRLNMAALIHEVKRGAVKAAKYSMGFTFYAKQCIAAVLILFTLSCIAMPETVLAGYHKLIEVIETVFEEYTEYRYRVNDDGGIEETFKPLKLGYLPDGMEVIQVTEKNNGIDILCRATSGKYINLHQKRIISNNHKISVMDIEGVYLEEIKVKNDSIELLEKDGRIYFLWIKDNERIIGQTNLDREELRKILNTLS